MKFAIIHSEQPDPPLEHRPRLGEAGPEHGPLAPPPPASPSVATKRPRARALVASQRAHVSLDRLRYAVESTSVPLAHIVESFEDTEPESGLETFRPALFGLRWKESDHG